MSVADAYIEACRIELQALKPGNVHVLADGHRMTVADFEASALASAAAIADRSLSVGARILEAVRRTAAAVHSNTNLGIVLLCAPLAAAAGELPIAPATLRRRVQEVLSGLDVDDAEAVFSAIRLASPAGLGDSAEHDVRQPARTSLLHAMAIAAPRDRIAAQYAGGFRDVFELGLVRLERGLARWGDIRWAASSAYLGLLAAFEDSHVARKLGPAVAERVRRDAAPLDVALLRQHDPVSLTVALLDFDTRLKQDGINPGTSADLTVASLFVHLLSRTVRPDAEGPVR
jgi:triphosphoribosyl-dephospho-CoA synthase